MPDQAFLYQILYALAARDGREEVLFGSCAPMAFEAFCKSMACGEFPELWFELPLAGDPWFDFHALTSRSSLDRDQSFPSTLGDGHPEVFSWFAAQGPAARQLALSWDTSTSGAHDPALQLLLYRRNPELMCDFLRVCERNDAVLPYRAFVNRLPQEWFAAYTGVFPGRPRHLLRVECIPTHDLQLTYAQHPDVLEEHLRHVGIDTLGNSIVPRCHLLANTPFALEFQFDVTSDGLADTTFSASVRFAASSNGGAYGIFDPDGAAGELMTQVEGWGLADDRWRLLSGTTFAKRVRFRDASVLLYCFPAFLKLRWREGQPLDAKTYLMAGVR